MVRTASGFGHASWKLIFFSRDSEESAPAEYPPDQPEADALDDDGSAYGAEEAELEEALKRELEEAERLGDDQEMDEDDESEAGSEDLESESIEDEEEDLEVEEPGEGDEDVDMADDAESKENAGTSAQEPQQHQSEVMVH